MDFWTEVGPESVVVDLMVAPDTQEMISEYLFVHAIYYEVMATTHLFRQILN